MKVEPAAGLVGHVAVPGDKSISHRALLLGAVSSGPMERVAEPLRRMGASIDTNGGGLPLRIDGGDLQPIDYQLPVASAQVKSAVLLAGPGANSRTTVREPAPTRDHTELMLEDAGARVVRRASSVTVE